MNTKGPAGMLMLLGFSLLSWLLMKWGGAWETFARFLVSGAAFVLALAGLYHVLEAASKEPRKRCYVDGCPEKSFRFCDFPTLEDNTCDRACCRKHMHVVGKRDYCQDHFEQEP